jgi:S-adenosylmethionine decarboxylase
MLDESHCSAHSYADLGLIAMDIFTCGSTDPRHILRYLCEEIPLGRIVVRECDRFVALPEQEPQPDILAARVEHAVA